MHHTRILMGIGGLVMGGSLFLEALDPSTGTPLYRWFGESGTILLFPFGTGIDSWMLFALGGCAAALIAAAVVRTPGTVLDRQTAVVALVFAIAGAAVAFLVYSEIDGVARAFFLGVGPGTYGVVAGGILALVGAGLQFRKQPEPPGGQAG
jgi:hypothetical protein